MHPAGLRRATPVPSLQAQSQVAGNRRGHETYSVEELLSEDYVKESMKHYTEALAGLEKDFRAQLAGLETIKASVKKFAQDMKGLVSLAEAKENIAKYSRSIVKKQRVGPNPGRPGELRPGLAGGLRAVVR